ncbi:TlpA family protein disulfide reductase [Microtetraspora malaysiensis]
MPDLAGSTLDGRDFPLAGLRGHVVLANVWASW